VYAFVGGLDAAGIPYTPAPAGMFLWVNLRAAFGSNQATWQDEEALWNCMAQQHRVVLTPGGCNAMSQQPMLRHIDELHQAELWHMLGIAY
jgi:hypothetical protein